MSCQKNGECLADHKHIPLANHQFSHDEIPFFAGPHPYWSWPLWKKNLGEKTKENDLLTTYLWPTYDILWSTYDLLSSSFPSSFSNIICHVVARYGSLWVVHIRLEPLNQWVNHGQPGSTLEHPKIHHIFGLLPLNIGQQGMGQNPGTPVVHIKMAGKWMWITH